HVRDRHPRPFTPPDLPFDVWPSAAVASAAIEPHCIVASPALAETAVPDDLDAVAVLECPLQRRIQLCRGSSHHHEVSRLVPLARCRRTPSVKRRAAAAACEIGEPQGPGPQRLPR